MNHFLRPTIDDVLRKIEREKAKGNHYLHVVFRDSAESRFLIAELHSRGLTITHVNEGICVTWPKD